MELVIRQLPQQDYLSTWQDMQNWVAQAQTHTHNEIWLLEHPAVYTQGQAGLPQHLLNANHIPVVQSDRGGQITYHGPGQLIAYFLLHLKQFDLQVRSLVTTAEQLIIDLLAAYDIAGETDAKRPGVYVRQSAGQPLAKIASLGFRIRHGICYHGVAINVKMDLTPFQGIHPCGQIDLPMTQMQDLSSTPIVFETVRQQFADLCHQCFSKQ